MKRYLIATIIIAAAVMGCDETIYKIELKPKGDKIMRTLAVWRTSGKSFKTPGDAELTAIAKAYSQDIPKTQPDTKHKFTATFSDAMPNDVGGAGRYNRFESKLGVASSYVERFRGNDRPGEAIEASLKAVDDITDIFIGYLESQMGSKPGFGALRKFMDTELRKDLKNLSVYSYLLSNPSRLNWMDSKKDDQDIQQQEVLGRVVAYLIERGYFEPSQTAFLRRAMSSGNDPKAVLGKALLTVEAKAKIPNKKLIPHLAALLANKEKLETSLDAYLRTTPLYKKIIKEKKPSDDKDEKKETSPTKLVLKPMLERAVHIRLEFFASSSRLDLQLALHAKPDVTNGKWNAKEKTVTWKGSLTGRDGNTTFLPEICYALWTQPDEKFQTAKFGKVILTGEKLMNYSLWRNGLTDDEAKIWDAALSKHKPGQDLDAASDSAKPTPYISEGVKLLQEAMKEKEPKDKPAD